MMMEGGVCVILVVLYECLWMRLWDKCSCVWEVACM